MKVINYLTKKERELEWIYKDEIFNPNIKSHDIIVYECSKCGEKASRGKNRFKGNKKDWLCKECKKKETNLERYGVENPAQLEVVKERIKQTNLEKYGVEYFSKTDESKERIKQTNLKKYGTEYIFQNEKFKENSKNVKIIKYNSYNNIEKIKETKLKKYGIEYYTNREKAKKTSLKKYGVEHYNNREKAKKTSLKKYGVEHPFKLEKFKKKFRQTNLERYGVENPVQLETVREKISLTETKNSYNSLKIISDLSISPLFSIEEYSGTKKNAYYKFQCNSCGLIFEDHLFCGRIPRCPTCFPLNRSKGEIELANFLKEHVDIIENDRKLIYPKEIDILIPSLNLAIEYNGEYWHQDLEKEKTKFELIEEKGYDLIVIWENDWNERKEEIKNDLLDLIN